MSEAGIQEQEIPPLGYILSDIFFQSCDPLSWWAYTTDLASNVAMPLYRTAGLSFAEAEIRWPLMADLLRVTGWLRALGVLSSAAARDILRSAFVSLQGTQKELFA